MKAGLGAVTTGWIMAISIGRVLAGLTLKMSCFSPIHPLGLAEKTNVGVDMAKLDEVRRVGF